MVVWEWEGFRVSFLKRDDIGKTLLHGESCALAEKVAIDVDANDAVGLRRVPGEPAIQHSRTATHLQDFLARSQVHSLNDSLDHATIAGRVAT
jgi:hypothetical protein